jgi:hypothetical protein
MDLAELAEALRSGQIDIAQWEVQMQNYLRAQYRVAMELTKGGSQNITQSDWGYEGSALKKQYEFLNNFAKDIANNPDAWMSGRLDARMGLYKESAYAALEDFQRRDTIDRGFTEERRVLGIADHCPDCLEVGVEPGSDGGWAPIGTLPAIGDSVCIVKCKCEFEYR